MYRVILLTAQEIGELPPEVGRYINIVQTTSHRVALDEILKQRPDYLLALADAEEEALLLQVKLQMINLEIVLSRAEKWDENIIAVLTQYFGLPMALHKKGGPDDYCPPILLCDTQD